MSRRQKGVYELAKRIGAPLTFKWAIISNRLPIDTTTVLFLVFSDEGGRGSLHIGEPRRCIGLFDDYGIVLCIARNDAAHGSNP